MNSNNCQILFITAALILSGCKHDASRNQMEIAAPVSVTDVTYGSINKTYNTTSTAIAASEAELKSEMAGKYYIQKNPRTGQPYKLGDKVNAKDLIVRIEDKSYENGISIESKKLNLEITEQEQTKQKSLYEKGGATLTDVRNTEIKIISAKLDYENALINLEKMNIRAPFDGVIVNLPHYAEGSQIASGSSVATVMDYRSMLLEINLPESAINEVKVGQKAYITHYTIPNDTINGLITELSPAISSETRTFKGKLMIENDELLIRPGMFVKADIVTDSRDSTIVIPKDIIRNDRNRKSVFVVDQGYAVLRTVRVGLEDKYNIEIVSGLEKDDQLVIRGQQTLREGSKVKIQK